MSKLSREVSRIFGYTVSEGEYRKEFERLEREGRVTSKNINQLVALILEYLEEQKNEK